MASLQDPSLSDDQHLIDQDQPSHFWYRTFFTVTAIIIAALLYCCFGKRRGNVYSEHVDGVSLVANGKRRSSVNGEVRTKVDVNGQMQPSSHRDRHSSSSSTEGEPECQRRRSKHTEEAAATHSSETAGTTSDEMEIIGSRHRTTIEIKHYKTAVLSSKNKDDQQTNGYGHVTSIWNGSMFHQDQSQHDQALSTGNLRFETSNLIEHDENARPRSTTDDLQEFAIVEVTVGQHTLDSYAVDQSKADKSLDDLYVDEHGDRVEEIVTWRKKEDSESVNQHRNSMEKRRSSVLEVIGAKDVGEVLKIVETLENVTDIIRLAGLESSHLIFGIDYTASNRQQGKVSFDGESLHSISNARLNPYQQVIGVMGKTLAPLARGGYIPAYGFGDIRTSDTAIFPLKSDGHCVSFDEVLEVYNEITPKIILSGPTNFAPLIYQAIEICKEFKRYHILVIVADGQVTNEPDTRKAIVEACAYPLSIIVVGVGDGPWDMMRVFDEKLPKRTWDNFHFVEFYKVTHGAKNPELSFAVQALLEIPDQYQQIKALGLLNFD